jgi:hypothetical protein
MKHYRKTTIIVGVLFIIATVAGVLSVLIFTGSLLEDTDYLRAVYSNANRVVTGALLELVMALAVAGTAIWLYPVFKRYNPGLALSYVGLRLIEAVFILAFPMVLLSLLTLGRESTQAAAATGSTYHVIGALLLAVNDWANWLGPTLVFCLGALVLNGVLFRTRLVPRFISVWGLIGAVLFIVGGLMGLYGVEAGFRDMLFVPIAVNEMVFAVWLIVRGFNADAIAALAAGTGRAGVEA